MYRWIALPFLLTLAGCLGGTYQPDVYYALEPEPTVTTAAAASTLILGVRPIEAPVIYRRPMVFRQGAYRVQPYDAALWAEEPAAVLTDELISALRASGRFADVASATAMRMPNLLLTGSIQRFEEVRDGDRTEAVCSVRIDVRHRDTGTLLYGATLEAAAPFDGTGHEAYAAAMSDAVSQVISDAVEGIVSAP